MADDRTTFDDSDYPFDPELSSEDEVLQELKRIIGEAEGLISDSGLESPPEILQLDTELEEEPVAVIRLAQAAIEPPPAEVLDGDAVHAEYQLSDQVGDQVVEHEYRLEEIINSIDEALERVAPVQRDTHLTDGAADTSSQERYLVFSLAGIKYAVPAAEVVEIGRVPAVTSVPNVPSWLLGVTNRRGDILSVVNLRSLLGMQGSGHADTARIVVVRSTSDEMMTGMIVDQVNGMLNVTPGTVQPPAGPIDTGVTPYLIGLCEHKSDLVAVLDLELLLASSEMRQFELV